LAQSPAQKPFVQVSPVVVLHTVLVVPLPLELQTTDVLPLHVAVPGEQATQP
jgi:hypothetical protein